MHRAPRPVAPFTWIAVLFEGGLAVVAVAIGWIFDFSPIQKLRMGEGDWWQIAAWGAAGAAPMFLGLAVVQYLPLNSLARLRDLGERLIAQLFRRCTIAEIAVISLCAGVGEEIFFRGLLQDGLAAWIEHPAGIWIALAISSLVFGLAHAITGMYVVLAALAGAYLGLLFLMTDNLLAPILAHAVYDFGAIVFVLRGTGERHARPVDESNEEIDE